jgi:hypothetical protein
MAETGPCQPDGHDGLICGEGNGAARIIQGTMSPSKHLALAWRATGSPPTEPPADDDLEDIVIRPHDGTIIARRKGEYWETPDGAHVNRLMEAAAWSPDSRLMIRTFEQRFNTSAIDLYAFDQDDKVTGPIDLLKILDPALHASLKRKVKNGAGYDLSVAGDRPITIDNRGQVHALIMMSVPKDGPFVYYAVTMQIVRKGSLDARILSIRPTREPS